MKQQIAFITGASHGIGRAIAKKLASEGWSLAINCNSSKEELESLAWELREQFHIPCLTLIGDVGKEAFIASAIQQIHQELGPITALINNAGIASIGLFQDMTPDMWNNIMSVNLNSVYNCCHFAVQDMLRRHCGKIINISSVWGLYGASCEVAYSATKGAINSFTKALAKELAPSNIQVNAIACGAIDTEMNGHLSPEELQELAEEIPCGTLGSPYGVANLAKLILNSDNYLTGQIIQYDGGWI